jgi:hypothetical protein
VARNSTWLFLDFHEGSDLRTIWFWRDLATDQSSQEFASEEAALEALRNGELEFSRLKDQGRTP